MKFIIITLLILISHTIEASETTIQLHTVSYHTNRAANYNEENYGVAIKQNIDHKSIHYINAGFYHNSEYNQSEYVGIGWEWPIGDLKIGITAGLLTGYEVANVVPYVLPTIKYGAFTLVFAPYPEAVTHLMIDVLEF